MKTWTVILERGENMLPLTFENQSGHRAFDRAHALCELHSCQFTQDDKARTLTVHASDYYRLNFGNGDTSFPQVLLNAKAAAERLDSAQCVYCNDAGQWVFSAVTWAYENPLRGHYLIRPNGTVISINGGPK